MAVKPEQHVTQLLEDSQRGRESARNQLFDAVYSELHSLASRRMRHEAAGNVLQTTALVNETYLRLFGKDAIAISGREHFFRLASSAMRRVLIDLSRSESAGKRGGKEKPLSFEDWMQPQESIPLHAQLDLQSALEALSAVDERAAQVVELVLFGGRDTEEIASLLGVTKRTVERDLAAARLFLNRHLSSYAAKP